MIDVNDILCQLINPFHTKSILLEFVHPINETSPRLDEQNQEKLIIRTFWTSLSNLGLVSWIGWTKSRTFWLLGTSELLSVKYWSIFPIFMKIFSKMSDTILRVFRNGLLSEIHITIKIRKYTSNQETSKQATTHTTNPSTYPRNWVE